MARKRWTVVIEWESPTCVDADEIVVYAATAAGAASRARSKWLLSNRLEIDAGMLRLVESFVLTTARLSEFA